MKNMYTLPDLDFEYNALEPYIDEETMHLHHDKHHAAYVNNLNDALKSAGVDADQNIEELLAHLDKLPDSIRMKVRNNGGGHYNHSLFWTLMAPDHSELGEGKLMEAIKIAFGDMASLQEKMSGAGVARFGSGWVWLVSEKGSLTIIDTPNQDSPVMEGKSPVLGIDVWEHAYYLKYKNMRADYLKAWWNVVNWPHVEELFTSSL